MKQAMGLLRRNDKSDWVKYRMQDKLFSIGDDYWIETDGGERVFKVDGKAVRFRDTLVLETPAGEELYKIQEKKLSVRDKMEIESGGRTVATVKKALVSPLRDRFSIELDGAASSRRRGTSSITSTRSSEAATRWPRSRSAGSGSGTRTASRSRPRRIPP